jgi:hypothetical protein
LRIADVYDVKCLLFFAEAEQDVNFKSAENNKKPDKRCRKFISFSFEINKYSKILGTTQSESAPPV